ncbi:Gti1/Pac2 family-domain-containing protein [Mucor mucedo]|uniref:Gti1/Pac2 family-domain-containing protein n=1 Tax=Mucor mucedo TaxID=29922 RepID=UPI00221EA1B3|nr:Gti1/Pac2 family-domain-containing protein [Mucor mucedo]KAI7894126.1 Gti1/Pac2 family-domain-containing protein [Mucor mucedo]
MLVTETFHGYIETTQDVLLIFEGCRRGLLPRICRRLQERERKMIRSGSIFVFDERESGIKRWTDGRVWSPSRILGNFLIYRELDKKSNNEKKMLTNETKRSFSIDSSVSMDRNKERQLVGSLSDSYRFKEDGLIKKTMSIIVNGVAQHLISYYDPNEVIQEKLRAPSSVPELASLEISPELLVKQNFRIPPLVETTFESNNHHDQNRLMHPLRSMSVGSIHRGQQDIMQQMYHSPYNNNNNNNNTNNSSNNNIPYSNSGTNFPSPSTSPSTPMLSPARQSYQQQHARHYSTSSISSNSLPRFDPRNYSDSATPNSNQPPNLGQLLNPIHPLNSNGSNDILQSIGMSSQYDYTTPSSNLRNSITSQHEEAPTVEHPHPHVSTGGNGNNGNGGNNGNNGNGGNGGGSSSSGGGGGGGGGGSGMSDYMHFYQRQPLGHHVNNNMFQTDDQLAYLNHDLGPDQHCLNNTMEHLMK